jgi:(1->4)-alpha-D-glucan 1-alpha-D-glucosylmutase
METELNTLSNLLCQIAKRDRHTQDFSAKQLKKALIEIIAFFPVYRTYIDRETKELHPEDHKFIEAALNKTKTRSKFVDPLVMDFISSVLMCQNEAHLSEERVAERRLFIMKFQQLTGPVMAKGLEDTSFYRYFLLGSLNEVGGDPDHFGSTLEQFHQENCERSEKWYVLYITIIIEK